MHAVLQRQGYPKKDKDDRVGSLTSFVDGIHALLRFKVQFFHLKKVHFFVDYGDTILHLFQHGIDAHMFFKQGTDAQVHTHTHTYKLRNGKEILE